MTRTSQNQRVRVVSGLPFLVQFSIKLLSGQIRLMGLHPRVGIHFELLYRLEQTIRIRVARLPRINRRRSPLTRQRLRRYRTSPKTLGEHLRKKRIDLSLSMTRLARLLGVGMTKAAIEKWEKHINYPTQPNRVRIINFLGFDPSSPTGGSM